MGECTPSRRFRAAPLSFNNSRNSIRVRALSRNTPSIALVTSSVVDVAGIGRAVREAGFQGKTCVMGTSLPSVAGEFLNDGAVDKIFLWDPLVAGQAQVKLALMLIKGEKIVPGLDLGLPGYRTLKRIPGTPHGLAGSGWIAIDKSNVRQYPF